MRFVLSEANIKAEDTLFVAFAATKSTEVFSNNHPHQVAVKKNDFLGCEASVP
jgi:proteasome assembly chaperone (PAC2) family protein